MASSTKSGSVISTHALREEGDAFVGKRQIGLDISTHALREEGDTLLWYSTRMGPYFYPRPPRGGRLAVPWEATDKPLFLPTPSARRATQWGELCDEIVKISTHALREEGDHFSRPDKGPLRISTHALREEGDGVTATPDRGDMQFLPTPSARRATQLGGGHRLGLGNFYPRPPRGGRPAQAGLTVSAYIISTHALREEGDGRGVRGRRLAAISTHALREEGDGPPYIKP